MPRPKLAADDESRAPKRHGLTLTYVAAILATACFGIALRWLGVVAAAGPLSARSNYSLLDRMLHRLAFGSSAVQLTAADVEATMYGSRYRKIVVQKPVFVTSIPRAGTTLVLQMLTDVASLATHKYRD